MYLLRDSIPTVSEQSTKGWQNVLSDVQNESIEKAIHMLKSTKAY